MSKLHELLAAEKTPTAAWNTLQVETMRKFGNGHFFQGRSKSLKMIEDTAQNQALEAAAKEEVAVPTNVYETLEYALGIFAQSEDLQYQKNATNRKATATVEFDGKPFLVDMPVDELLGLEARLVKIREMIVAMPTLDAAKYWNKRPELGPYIWELKYPEETTKTEKVMVPVVLSEATDKHPAQVKEATKDVVVGKFTTVHRTGAATAVQKSEAIKRVDALMVEIKKARMRANETEAVTDRIGQKIADLLLEPLK